jgi:ABC-type uncharacterized transport system substrate-binding protein
MDMKKRSAKKKPKAIKTKKRKTGKLKAAEAKTSRKRKTAKERSSSKPKGEKKRRTGNKLRILAVAAVETGKTKEHHIATNADVDPTFVRPYINGLIAGLLPRKLGKDYDIWYRQILHSSNNGSFAPGSDTVPNDLIFAMSLQVVQFAVQFTKNQRLPKTPIVFPSVSDPNYIGNPLPSNVAGINAQRSQTAGTCFADFLQTVPTLQTGTVAYLRCKNYGPSDDAEQMILGAAHQFPNVTLKAVDVTDQQDLKNQLSNLPACNGLQVLPIDFCFGAAGDIVDTVQGKKNIPTFFPIPDWVQPAAPQNPALSAYGVSQYNCGYLAANIVTQIAWGGVSPSAIGVQAALPASFDWLVSQSAANGLNIQLDLKNLQASGAQIVP